MSFPHEFVRERLTEKQKKLIEDIGVWIDEQNKKSPNEKNRAKNGNSHVIGKYIECAISNRFGCKTEWDQYYESGGDSGVDGHFKGFRLYCRGSEFKPDHPDARLIVTDSLNGKKTIESELEKVDLMIHGALSPQKNVILTGWTPTWLFHGRSHGFERLPERAKAMFVRDLDPIIDLDKIHPRVSLNG